MQLVRGRASTATRASALAEPEGERRAAFCRLEHVVPWAIQGAHWDPGGCSRAATSPTRASGAAPIAATTLGDARVLLVRHRGEHRIAGRLLLASTTCWRLGEGRRALADGPLGAGALGRGRSRRSAELAGARASRAAMTNATCSSKSTPSSSAPRADLVAVDGGGEAASSASS